MSNPNFDTILATTVKNYRRKLTNNVFLDFPLGFWLMDKGRTRMENGGQSILENLRYALGQAESYTGWDQFAIAVQTGLTAAEYPWKQARASVAINNLERAQNSGRERMINLVEAKVDQAEDSLKLLFNQMLWGDGTGNSGKHWAGLQSYISTTPAGAGVVGGIDQATQAYWRNQVNVSGAVVSLALVKNMVNLCKEGNNKPDAMFTTLPIFESVESKFQPQVQYRDVKAANAGFDNITVNQVPLFGDNSGSAVANRIYVINSKYITLVGHSDYWFVSSGELDGTASSHATSGAANYVDGTYKVISVFGNLTCSNRARNGVVTFTGP